MIEFRPPNAERPLRHGMGRKVVDIEAVDPESVVCPESIFVNTATTLGIPLVDFCEFRRTLPDGRVQRALRWRLEVKSVDGAYTLEHIRKCWSDPQWLALNPTHEIAIARVVSDNLMRMAERVRKQPFLWVFSRERAGGKFSVMIPSNATEEQRAKWIERFEVAA